jgi:hypothetical protein
MSGMEMRLRYRGMLVTPVSTAQFSPAVRTTSPVISGKGIFEISLSNGQMPLWAPLCHNFQLSYMPL